MGKNFSLSWILDTDVSNHVTGTLECLHDSVDVSYPNNLPDGVEIVIVGTKRRKVAVNGGLILKNVLFFPKLTCNLLSVPQLIDDNKCIVQFTNLLCVMQDRCSRNQIGVGEHKGGLYFYHGIPVVHVVRN